MATETLSIYEALYMDLHWNDKHPEGDPDHCYDLIIAQAHVQYEVGYDRYPSSLGNEVGRFLGAEYNRIIEANKKAANLEEFTALVKPLYEAYAQRIAEYEASKNNQ